MGAGETTIDQIHSMSLLVISALTVRIGGRTLLDGADLTVESGRRIGLVGRNGAGKSTLLRIVSGQLAPDAGSVTLGWPVKVIK